MDRRKKKSQQSIYHAFLELSKTQKIEKITINDIAYRADVSRGTVYLNFQDKYDLLDKMIQHYLNHLFSVCRDVSINEKEYFPKIVEKMYLYLNNNNETYRLLFTKSYYSKFRLLFEQNLLQAFETQAAMNKLSDISLVSLQFLTTGITGCIIFWLQEKEPATPKEAAAQLNNYLKDQRLLVPFTPSF